MVISVIILFLPGRSQGFVFVFFQVGYDMTKKAANTLFEKTNYKPQDVDVVELHDCFSANELITYEALGLCEPGKAGELIDSGDNTYGGQYVINPSGGLISKGHPLGATGE
jgi:sterol carrier protein 2